jgi:error-prone DNA polymerase
VEKEVDQEDLFSAKTAKDANAEESPNGENDEQTEDCPLLPMDVFERLEADYGGLNLTLGPHPMALVRNRLPDIWRATDLAKARHGQILRIGGNVICRQRPGTAKGFVFISLEDETGVGNAIVSPQLFEKERLVITQEPFLVIEGKIQNRENVLLLQAQRIERLPHEQLTGTTSYDFH